MESTPSQVWKTASDDDLPRSFLKVIQMYLDRTATSPKCGELDAYSANVGWFSFIAKCRMY